MQPPASPRDADARALLAMCAGAALIGTNALMVRWAGVPPTVSAFWRMLFGGGVLCAWLLLRGRWRRLPARAWLWCALPALMFACDLWSWHRSILLVGPGLATLLGNTQVFFLALIGAACFGERLGPRFAFGMALAFAGLWLLLGHGWDAGGAEFRLGVWLGLLTGLCYSVYTAGLRTAQRRAGDGHAPPLAQVLAIVSLGSAAVLGGMGAAEGASFRIPDSRSLALLASLALFGHCLAWVLISRAMQRLPVALVGLLLLLQPVIAFLLDVALLGRRTSMGEWCGLGLSLAGIFVASLKGRTRLPEPA